MNQWINLWPAYRKVVFPTAGLDHLTSLKEITAHPTLHKLTDYQRWVDEQNDLADAIISMYQVDTSPVNMDVEIEEEEEPMSGWINSLTITIYFPCLEFV